MRDFITIGNNQIEKHNKYKTQYKPYSVFWGLGIEEEVYLEFEQRKQITEKEFLLNHKKERYSVDYYSNYKKEILTEAFENILKRMGSNTLYIPILLNSHSFTKTDRYGEHETIYSTKREPNPKYSGKTLISLCSEIDNFFNEENATWIFDGDTIEFISVDFYNAKLLEILEEIELNKRVFITKLSKIFELNKIYSEYGKIKIMEQNYPFGKYLTNPNNIGMFNNGTIHLNITLPTKLDLNAQIKNKEKFIKKHKNAIKLIQWFEPLIIGVYGTPDPFATLSGYVNKNKFSNCSQRNVISRYIGIGIYDTDRMESGKILTKPISELPMGKLDYWWFNRFHESSAYTKLEQIGLDINFNKHWNHGIEIRFLDYIPNVKLVEECYKFIIWIIDLSLEQDFTNLPNPIIDRKWNNLVYNIFIEGINYNLNTEDKKLFQFILGIKLKSINIVDIYYEIYEYLKKKYTKEYIETNNKSKIYLPSGGFSKLVLESEEKLNNQKELEVDKKVNFETEEVEKDEFKNKLNSCCILM